MEENQTSEHCVGRPNNPFRTNPTWKMPALEVTHNKNSRKSKQRRRMNDQNKPYGVQTGGDNDKRPRRPPGLRGKEIGLYYRDLSLKRKENDSKKIDAVITLPTEVMETVENALSKLDRPENSTSHSKFAEYFQKIKHTSFEEFLIDKRTTEDTKDSAVDMVLKEKFKEMMCESKYAMKSTCRANLPVHTKKSDILKAIAANQVVLISGDTGCGKTTQIPQYILDDFLSSCNGSSCKIFCTQPRRISAITVAERVAWERCEKVGVSVGYQIRLQSVIPRDRGSITFCTTGILLKRFESDPLLNGVSHLILDEVHERDANTDIVMGLLQKIKEHRPELKLILMSATFSVDTFRKYFGDCTSIEVPGTLFPVTEMYLEDILEKTKFSNFPTARKEKKREKYTKKGLKQRKANDDFQSFIEPYARSISNQYSKFVVNAIRNPRSEEVNIELLTELIMHITFNEPEGAILVFLPGYESISSLHKAIEQNRSYSRQHFRLFGLHSMMPTTDQKLVFEKPPDGVRKIILSTPIAETSITIEDIVYVIDTGKVKVLEYDMETNLQTLKETWTTLANSKQRKGRAGRVRPGVCYRLYTRAREYTFETFPTPEILKIRLESIVLNLKILRIHDVTKFFVSLISVPSEALVTNSIDFLKRLNALEEEEFLTPLGLHLARLPVEPQIGKMILLASFFKCLDPITSVAASLSFKDPFYRPLGKEKLVDDIRLRLSHGTRSDHLMVAYVLAEYRQHRQNGRDRTFCYDNFLSGNILNQLENMKIQFCEILMEARFISHPDPAYDENNTNSDNINLLRSIISAALYPNIAKVKKAKMVRNLANPVLTVITPEDGKVAFHPSSINSREWDLEDRFFTYFAKQKSTSIFLFDTTMVNPLSLILFSNIGKGESDDDGNWFISLSGLFRFKTNYDSAKIFIKLREWLENLLMTKAINPSTIDSSVEDLNIINAILDVLSTESD